MPDCAHFSQGDGANLCFAPGLDDHRIDGAGRDHWRSPRPSPLLKQVPLKQVAQDHIQVNFESL